MYAIFSNFLEKKKMSRIGPLAGPALLSADDTLGVRWRTLESGFRAC